MLVYLSQCIVTRLELLKVTGKGSEKEDDKSVDEKYLIATSEQVRALSNQLKCRDKLAVA